jgi:glycosyltransferase involved in cell wall biosynthesis
MARVLLVAPGVDRGDVGEAWVGFQWASRLGERHDVTLLTHRKRGRASAVDQLPGVEVVEWDEPRVVSRPERFSSLLKPWYPYFHHRCVGWIRDALAQGRTFDIGHQPTPVAMRYPSPLATSGIPYVIGPVGGSLETPEGFRDEETAPWYVGLRRLDGWRMRWDPQLRRSYGRAGAVCGIAGYVGDILADVPLHRLVVMSETGLEAVPEPVERPADRSPVRLLFVGRVIRTKGVRDAVRAMGRLRDLAVTLDVVGDGFDRAACEELARELGVADVVSFHGQQPRSEVDEFYRRGDVFVFPSYREPGGNAPFEALSYGLPMIVADRGGPASAVTPECAVLITPRDPAQYACDIASAVRTLVTNPDRRAAMGRAARERALEVGTWEQRVRAMEQVYAEVLGRPL